MKIGFRTHASNKLGFGHLSRCLTLARAAREHECVFLVEEPEARAVIEREGFAIGDSCDVMVIDNYTLDGDAVRGAMVLDDPMERKLAQARWIVNPTAGASYPSQATQLIGPRYAMIREDFRSAPRKPGPVRRILVTMGGSDPDERTLGVVKILMHEFSLDVVVGPLFSEKQKRALAGLPVRLHLGVRNLAPLMRECDLCVGAGGLSVHEFAATGLPALAIELACNQHRNLTCLAQEGVLRITSEKTLLADTRALVADEKARMAMSQAGQSLVDGMGARRVIEALK